MPIEVVATTEPFALVERSELVIPVIPRFVVVALVKALFPENVLLSPSNVEDAALIVMLLEPLKETPLMVRAVWSAVAVPALPPIESDVAVPVSPVPAPEKELAKMVPEAERLVVDALASVVFPVTFKVDPIPKAPVTVKAPMLVDEALEMKPAPKVWRPVQLLVSASSVEDAALMVMLDEPLNETPLMVRAVWRIVAVPALPETDPVMVDEKMLDPEKVLLLARSVEEAALMV